MRRFFALFLALAPLTAHAEPPEQRWSSILGAHLLSASPTSPSLHEGTPEVEAVSARAWSDYVRIDLALIDAAAPCAHTLTSACDDAIDALLTERAAALQSAIPIWRELARAPDPSPRREQARFYLGCALLAIHQDEEAIATLRDLSREGDANPYAPFASARLADIFLGQGAPDIALPLYLTAAAYSPAVRAHALHQAGWARASNGEHQEAMRLFIEALQQLDARTHQLQGQRSFDETLRSLALVYAEVGIPEKASLFYSSLLGDDPRQWDALATTTEALAHMGRDADMRAVREQLLAGAPSEHPARTRIEHMLVSP